MPYPWLRSVEELDLHNLDSASRAVEAAETLGLHFEGKMLLASESLRRRGVVDEVSSGVTRCECHEVASTRGDDPR